jgi:GNAT superfamily N-acetyltransferase
MKIVKISKGVYKKFTDNETRLFFQDFFGKAGSKEYWTAYSEKGKKLLFAAKEDNRIVGTICLNLEYKIARIGMFVVLAGKRNSGIGSMLLAKCEQTAKRYKCVKVWLHALPITPAYKFYINHGYFEEARLKKHFGGKDLCIMSKFI